MIKSRSTAHGWPKLAFAALAFAFCVAGSLPVLAQTGLNGVLDRVSTLDKNFDMADKNHDGLLSKDEAKAGNVPFIVNHFDAIDTQHRGLVSKQDVHAFIQRSLQKQSQPASASSAGIARFWMGFWWPFQSSRSSSMSNGLNGLGRGSGFYPLSGKRISLCPC